MRRFRTVILFFCIVIKKKTMQKDKSTFFSIFENFKLREKCPLFNFYGCSDY